MKHLVREFIWLILSILCLAIIPWWQAVIAAAVTAPLLLRLTERGFKRRLISLFMGCILVLLAFHAQRSLVATAVSKLFKIPHFTLLAILSAGCFSLVIALAAESVLWAKYSFRKMGQKISLNSNSKKASA